MELPVIMAAYNKNDDIRMKSSSGGLFYLFAKCVIDMGGIVFGAAFDEEYRVIHQGVESMEEIPRLLGSKYVQSDMNRAFEKVKENLAAGRKVLFSGTPCQIAGLKSFLGKEYNNLFLVDFVCHGTPSPKVWRRYLQEQNGSRKPIEIYFRDKTEGWLNYSVKIVYSDGTVYRRTLSEDPFMKGFLKDIYLRPSCYHCKSKGIMRGSDITLADFWGVEEIKPELFDDKGTSVLILQSGKGIKLFEQIKGKINAVPITAQNLAEENMSALESVNVPKERKYFFAAFNRESGERFEEIVEKCTELPLAEKMKKVIKIYLKRMLKVK